MPLFSEHISNMYYGGSPSYHTTHKAPSYGYKSSFSPLGTSYSASYLNPGGSYSKHSSLSSYSRAPLTPRWIPGVSRSYSPLLTPISERGASSPIRINSPRRIPISSRTYGTPNYIQRPININTESIDVSRDRYHPKPAEPSTRAPSPPPAPAPVKDKQDSVKDSGNSPFMPRVDGKPVTGIDSSPGKQRSTIKRGRTVVRLHTIKRKEKDSPRKATPSPQSQNSEENKEAEMSESSVAPAESLSWREKLSDDLIYVDKRDKKSLGTKLVEKFIVKDTNENINQVEKSDTNSSKEQLSNSMPSTPLPESDVPSTTKSLDRRCSMELLAEQANLLDSLIRGENLSTATLDISKIGIADETQNKFSSSNSIKRRKIDDDGNPLKTTKSDHSLHDTLIQSIKKDSQLYKDSKTLTKGRSLKKSHSGGSICRLDSITELPKEAKESMDLPAIQERFSPKEEKSEKQSKVKTKITSSVEISPPSSPLKFRIENITVEEKHHTLKKEVSFTYETDEMPVQDITLQGPKNTLRRPKERNSIKKKSIKVPDTDPISSEPDDGNFWAKIGKRETVYLVRRKKNLEEEKEKNKRAFLWFPEDEEADTSREAVIDESNVNQEISPNSPLIPKPNNEIISPESEISSGIIIPGSNKPLATDITTESKKHNPVLESSKRKLIRQDAETMEETAQISKYSCDSTISFEDNLPKLDTEIIKLNKTLEEIKTTIGESIEAVTQLQTKNITVLDYKSQGDLNVSVEADIPDAKTVTDITLKLKRTKSEGTDLNQNSKIITEMTTENQLSTQDITTTKLPIQVLTLRAKSEDRSLKKEPKQNIGIDLSLNSSTRIVMEHEYTPGLETMIRNKNEKIEKDSKAKINKKAKIATNPSDKTKTSVKRLSTEKSVQILTNPVTTELIQNLLEVGNDESLSNESSVNLIDAFRSSKTSSVKLIIDEFPPTSTLAESPEQVTDKVSTSLKGNTIDSAKSNIDINMAKSGEKSSEELTLKTHATSNIEEKEPDSSIKEQVEPLKDTKTNIPKQIFDGTKSILEIDEKTDSRKKTNKIKGQKDNIGQNVEMKREKRSSNLKEKICETCKKPVLSDVPSKSKSSIENTTGTEISVMVENPTNNVQEVKSNVAVEKQTELEGKLGLDSLVVDSNNSNENDAPCLSVIKTTDIPNEIVASEEQVTSQDPTGEENKAEKGINENKDSHELKVSSIKQAKLRPSIPVKEEKATKPLIATPRPLKKRVPQVIHSDSDTSSEEESSEEEDSDSSEECCEFYECENNPDGRTSTGSNDSGFDSSAPTSPASFLQIKKDCDVNCHRKCEKLTANLCGVNQRLLVEALASRTASKRGGESPGPSSSASAPDGPVADPELELEQSTAYSIFRKTGRFTPPAKSIPRFRKYNIEDFQFIKVLGKGSFGKVLLAELRDTEYYYAVKCLKKDVVLEDDDVECTLIERKVLALGTNHPYLCHLFATFQTDSHLFFVMEYLNGGDLMFHIQQSGRFPESRARFYGAEIVSGLKFLHKRGIVYRDLKLDNILLDYEGHVRIADFGMCKLQIYLDKTADTFCGTPDYMAPEIIKGLKYNQTVDWWSFGVLLYEMLIGQSPFSGCDEDELFWSICNEMPSYPRFLSREALTVLTRLLDKDAKTRLGGTDCMHGDVREQDFFHAVHWDKLERRELETPFKPRVRHPLDTQYFDREFTGERPRLTAVEPHVMRSMDQEPFRGFSYTNPNATDR